MKSSDFRKSHVWQKAMQLTTEIYSLVKFLPREETYALSNQMRRVAVSIPSNIAEGQGRNSKKEFIQFIAVARGSLWELSTQLELCGRLNYLSPNQRANAEDLICEIEKMLNALAGSIQSPDSSDD
ncbi:MAG: four helix bundle protein [Muribaculaceae bacterium]|nr:four helix bundle protein [Muribaculaceae bacterium]